jgi:hypothetical protein
VAAFVSFAPALSSFFFASAFASAWLDLKMRRSRAIGALLASGCHDGALALEFGTTAEEVAAYWDVHGDGGR